MSPHTWPGCPALLGCQPRLGASLWDLEPCAASVLVQTPTQKLLPHPYLRLLPTAAAPGKLQALKAALAAGDKAGSGLVSADALQAALQAVGSGLCAHQTITICRRLGQASAQNEVSATELLSALGQ